VPFCVIPGDTLAQALRSVRLIDGRKSDLCVEAREMCERNAVAVRRGQIRGEYTKQSGADALSLIRGSDVHSAQHDDVAHTCSANEADWITVDARDVHDIVVRDAGVIPETQIELIERRVVLDAGD